MTEQAKTLRDEFAMAALQGLLYLVAHKGHDVARSHEGAAQEAYRLADAMLAERARSQGAQS
jgi:hypothetical protein